VDNTATWETLRRLVGTWEGKGTGEFPTLEPFEYRELLVVDELPERLLSGSD